MCHAPCICSCCNRLIRQPIRLPEYNFDQDDDNQELHHSIDLWPTILQRRCTDHYLDNVNSNHPEDELDDYSRREDIPSANNPSLHAKKQKKNELFFLFCESWIRHLFFYQTLAALALINPSLSGIKSHIRFFLVSTLL